MVCLNQGFCRSNSPLALNVRYGMFDIARLSENCLDIIRQSFVDIVSQLDHEAPLEIEDAV